MSSNDLFSGFLQGVSCYLKIWFGETIFCETLTMCYYSLTSCWRAAHSFLEFFPHLVFTLACEEDKKNPCYVVGRL